MTSEKQFARDYRGLLAPRYFALNHYGVKDGGSVTRPRRGSAARCVSVGAWGVHAAMPCLALAISGQRIEASSLPPVCSSARKANSGGQSLESRNCDRRPFETPIMPLNTVRDGDAGNDR